MRFVHHKTPLLKKAIEYVYAHLEDDTEIDHFLVVVDALDRYNEALAGTDDHGRAQRVFTEYLTRLGEVMEVLTQRMISELEADGKAVPASAQTGAKSLH